MQPQAIELEQAVLGALMIDNESLSDAIDSLKTEYFYAPKHQKIFEAITNLFNNTQPPEKLNKEELAYAILDCQAENAKATENPIRKPRPRTKSTKNKAEEVKDSETQSIHKKKKESQTSNQTAHNQSKRKDKQKPIQNQKNNESNLY